MRYMQISLGFVFTVRVAVCVPVEMCMYKYRHVYTQTPAGPATKLKTFNYLSGIVYSSLPPPKEKKTAEFPSFSLFDAPSC